MKGTIRLIALVLLLAFVGADTGLHIVGMLVCSADGEGGENNGSGSVGQLPLEVGGGAVAGRSSDQRKSCRWCPDAVQKQQSVDEWAIGLFSGLNATDILLAVFTVMLVGVGHRQADISDGQREIMDRQVSIARQTYLADHRPKLILRAAFSLMSDDLQNSIVVHYRSMNIGGTRAWITRGALDLELVTRENGPNPLLTPDAFRRHTPMHIGAIEPGESRNANFVAIGHHWDEATAWIISSRSLACILLVI